MDINETLRLISKFRWATLRKMYGCAHSSIIGFISTEWINYSDGHSILDGAPSPKTGGGRTGQRNADIILCDNEMPFAVVEVETQVCKYEEKIAVISTYLNNEEDFKGLQLGILIMLNLTKGDMRYRHNWDDIKEKIKKEDNYIALISIIKEKQKLNRKKPLDNLRCRNPYYQWTITEIEYWFYDNVNRDILTGHLL